MPKNVQATAQWHTFHMLLVLLLLLLSHFSRVWLCVTPETAAHQAPVSLGFSRQEHWSGLPFPPPMHESEKWKWSRSVMSDPQQPHRLQPSRLLHPWDFPGKSTGVGVPWDECNYVVFEHSLALPFFQWKLTFSSPVATAEFSKFAGILSATLS